jgi:hypothetical protein
MEIEDWPLMESCPRRSAEPLTSLARRTVHGVVTGTDGVLDRAKRLPGQARARLCSGDRMVGP